MTNGFYVFVMLDVGIWMCIDWFYVCNSREATLYQGMANIVGSNEILMHCFDNVIRLLI
jgi:hypothetical protein